MADPEHVANTRLARQKGLLWLAYLPAEKEPATRGGYGAVAAHCGVSPETSSPLAATGG